MVGEQRIAALIVRSIKSYANERIGGQKNVIGELAIALQNSLKQEFADSKGFDVMAWNKACQYRSPNRNSY